MDLKLVMLLMTSLFSRTDGFFGEIFDFVEDLPLRFISGTCYLFLDKAFRPGEFELLIKTDKPTIDLYTWNFISFDRHHHGTSYRLLNIRHLKPGFQNVKFTLSYVGSRYYIPNAWCQEVTPAPTLPPGTSTTIRPSTPKPSTTTRSTTTTRPLTTSTTTTTTRPITTSTTTTTTRPITTSTTTTTPTTTSTTSQTTTTSDITITPDITPTVPFESSTTTMSTTLGTGPPRPTAS